jgi:hypothetical protein
MNTQQKHAIAAVMRWPKVHTHIGQERSLCGLAPKHGYKIVSFESFFTALPAEQCGTCLERIKQRGYSIEFERLRYRKIYDEAQERSLIA